jgi:hypothetical protein
LPADPVGFGSFPAGSVGVARQSLWEARWCAGAALRPRCAARHEARALRALSSLASGTTPLADPWVLARSSQQSRRARDGSFGPCEPARSSPALRAHQQEANSHEPNDHPIGLAMGQDARSAHRQARLCGLWALHIEWRTAAPVGSAPGNARRTGKGTSMPGLSAEVDAMNQVITLKHGRGRIHSPDCPWVTRKGTRMPPAKYVTLPASAVSADAPHCTFCDA